MTTSENRARPANWVALSFGITALTGIALAIAWWVHASTQITGALLALALATLALGLAIWANRLTPQGPFVQQRHDFGDQIETEAAVDDIAEGAQLPRRRMVVVTLLAAGGAIGAALAVPLASLGPRPRDQLRTTAWRAGQRAVGTDGRPVMADGIPLDGIATVFPEGHAGAADAQVVLVRVHPRLLDLPTDRAGWAVDGLVAYSKVCTHAGCPVGLYSAEKHELLCPCHQSSFDVLRGAEPRHGPAAWPLPQLPLRVDDNGIVVAGGPLSAPVGPGWWREDET